MVQGFFETFLLQIAQSINENFNLGTVLEVKSLRRVLEIKSSDRSKIIFLARALQKLNDLGFLEYVGHNSPKKFKMTSKIPIDDLQKKISH